MRPPRLIILISCFICLPIFLTTRSLLSAHPRSGESPSSVSSSTSRFKSLFSFHAPSSLFPPSAIISLTDDNSTFFLARPAAFGPLLPQDGLSGPLWIGSGFGDNALRKGGLTTGAEGELGCSDVPGWEDGDNSQKKKDFEDRHGDEKLKTGNTQTNSDNSDTPVVHEKRSSKDTTPDRNSDVKSSPDVGDGTDDHLHHTMLQSDTDQAGGNGANKNKVTTHADIQSLQESAEIAGKVVLLSRGGCGFLEKVKWVQRRGGTALIVGDDTRGGGLVTMYARGDTSNVTIPSLFTSHTTAHLLSSLIPAENGADDITGGKSQQSPQIPTKQGKKNSQNSKSATPTKRVSKPTATPPSRVNTKPGAVRSFLSFLGVSNDTPSPGHIHADSRRPPSSGNIDWVMLDPSSDNEAPPLNGKENGQAPPPRATKESESRQSGNDGFVIGVQDWRDPDLVDLPKGTSTSTSKPPVATPPSGSKTNAPVKNVQSNGNGLKGGSITPGSGEYSSHDKQSKGKSVSTDPREQHDAPFKSKQDGGDRGAHWWPDPFGWGDDEKDDGSHGPSGVKLGSEDGTVVKPAAPTQKSSGAGTKQIEHEGLWVTLTPTSMATSPFFDTLLVLVVSPLVTLTVVYALLLLRSRIRRRRWRAPKAVVDRLPIRTYHTMSPRSSTPRTGTPETSSPSSPLLSRTRSPLGRPRSQTTCGSLNTSSPSPDHGAERSPYTAEKSSSRVRLSHRKYTGRQVECVVCLEEYIDGQSKVMSLPCGHEFHADCITPWLTTRRRTCPICKGDVVRSLDRSSGARQLDQDEQTPDGMQSSIAGTRNDSPSSAIPIPEASDDTDSDLERGESARVPLLGGQDDASSQSSWRNLASLSLSALSGDSMWHQPRHTRSDRNR